MRSSIPDALTCLATAREGRSKPQPLFNAYYEGASPDLLMRIRDWWAASRLDLQSCWSAAIAGRDDFRDLDPRLHEGGAWCIDQFCLYDQCQIWVEALRRTTGGIAASFEDGGWTLSRAQILSLNAICSRLADEMAAVRLLAVIGLATPAMQITRSISEDVDLALLLLVRPKLAKRFVECRTPEDASSFWRKHIGGGRAFRSVTDKLYEVGLDHASRDDYRLWRHEALTTLGAAVHTSFLSGCATMNPAESQSLSAAQNSLYFSIVRIQEMCAFSTVLATSLHDDFARFLERETQAGRHVQPLFGVARFGHTVLLDQVDWLMENRGDDRVYAEIPQ